MPKTCRRHRRRSRHLRRRPGIWDDGGGGHEGYSTILILAAVGLRVIVGEDRFRFFGSRMMTRLDRSSLQKCADGLGVEYQIFVGAVAEMMRDGVIVGIVGTAVWKQMKFRHAPKECKSAAAVKEAILLVLLDSIIGSPRPDENLIEIVEEFTGMAYKGNSQRISFAQSDLPACSVHCRTYYERDKAFLRDLADRKTVHIDWSSVATQLSHDICTTYSDNESFRRFLSKRNRVALKVFQKHILSPENENNEYPISNESLRVNFNFGGKTNKRTVGSNPSLQVPRHKSLELAFSESDFDNYDAIIIRSDFRAEFVSLHPELCDIIMREERRRLGFECFINKIIIEGIQKCGEEDHRQTKIPGSKSAYTGNYGASSREQPRQKVVGDVEKQRLIGSRQAEAVLKDYGCNTPYSIDRKYAPFYHQKLAAVFAQSWLDEEDQWYHERNKLHGKKARTLRLSHNKPFDERDSLKLPYILESSVPLVAAKNDKDLHYVHRMVSAKFESQNRRISEELLLRTFGAIPFSYLGFIQMENEHKMFDEYLPGHPQRSVSRVLPKGSLGIQQQKPLHDDCNGIVSHGVWSCLLSDEGSLVDLIFTTTDFSWSIRSTTNRFCLFNGLLPHKSKLIQEHHVNSDSKKIRVHSSCYVRALHEYIGAFVFSENYRGQVLLIDEHRKYFKDETYNN